MEHSFHMEAWKDYNKTSPHNTINITHRHLQKRSSAIELTNT
jgi:hypothetical protein